MLSSNELERLADEYAISTDENSSDAYAGFIAGYLKCEEIMKDRFPSHDDMSGVGSHLQLGKGWNSTEASISYASFERAYYWLKQKLFGGEG